MKQRETTEKRTHAKETAGSFGVVVVIVRVVVVVVFVGVDTVRRRRRSFHRRRRRRRRRFQRRLASQFGDDLVAPRHFRFQLPDLLPEARLDSLLATTSSCKTR